MQIKTVFLDAGGVLVHPNWQRVSETLAKYGVSVSTSALQSAEPIVKRQHDTPEIATSGFDLFHSVIEAAGVPDGEDITEALREIADYDRLHNAWDSISDELELTLRHLRDNGYKIVVVSNSNGTLKNMLRRLGLFEHFDLVFDSHEEGVSKPDPKFFKLALDASASTPETTLHVGDFYHIDVIGARSVGIRPLLLDAADLYGDQDCDRIRTLAALSDYLSS
jgi:HAD superfamily hydrolase (TIGR01549 family)